MSFPRFADNPFGNQAVLINTQEETSWIQTYIDYFKKVFTTTSTDESSLQYPIKPNRYFNSLWNQDSQDCYTAEEIQLISMIQKIYIGTLPNDHQTDYFALQEERSWYGLLQCQKPALQKNMVSDSFTLPNREAKDATIYPLWSYADNIARQIANWQSERIKNQSPHLMNDPVMKVFDELRDWFFDTLTQKDCREENIALITRRQSYIRNLIHRIPEFGPDQSLLNDIQKQLDAATKIILSCTANKQLSELLADVFVKTSNLEMTIGTNLHFLLTNEAVSDNFAESFTTGAASNCDASPICKIYRNVKNYQVANDKTVSKLQNFNPFYHFEKKFEDDASIQLDLSLRKELLSKINFPDFISDKNKQSYLEAVAMLDSLMQVSKTVNNFKSVQSALGTCYFAAKYLEETEVFANNFAALINKIQFMHGKLIDASYDGWELILTNPRLRTKYKNFANNLRALDTKFAKDTTVKQQLDDYCLKTKDSLQIYLNEMRRLAASIKSDSGQKQMNHAMSSLLTEINQVNAFLSAQLRSEPLRIDKTYQFAISNLVENVAANNEVNRDIDAAKLFDYGKWDRNIKLDVTTQEPIFTYRVYKQNQEVGSAEFFSKPLICMSVDKNKHNVLSMNGVLSQISINEQMSLGEICERLPSTLIDKIYLATTNGIATGLFVGSTNVIAASLHASGTKPKVAKFLSGLVYYGTLFTFDYYHFYQQIQNEDQLAKISEAFYAALYSTGQLWMFNSMLQAFTTLLNETSNVLSANNYSWLSTGVKKCASLMRYSLFAYRTSEQGIAATSAGVLSGALTQIATEKLGGCLIKRYQH